MKKGAGEEMAGESSAAVGLQSITSKPPQPSSLATVESHVQPLASGPGSAQSPIVISSTPPVPNTMETQASSSAPTVAPTQGASTISSKQVGIPAVPEPPNSTIQVSPRLSNVVALASSAVKAVAIQLPQMLLSRVVGATESSSNNSKEEAGNSKTAKDETQGEEVTQVNEDSDDDFKPSKKRFRQPLPARKGPVSWNLWVRFCIMQCDLVPIFANVLVPHPFTVRQFCSCIGCQEKERWS